MKLNTLEDVFVDGLRDLYNAEQQLIRALPKLARAASSPQLRSAFEDHLTVTENQAHRLEEIFDELHMSPRGKSCPGMQGIIEEGRELISDEEECTGEALDAALIAAAQKVEHYEIGGYGCCRAFAQTLGLAHIADLLQQSLNEESEADHHLSELAESSINESAAHAEPVEDNGRSGSSRSRSRRGRSGNGRSKSGRARTGSKSRKASARR
jgi:ferritin-like metal-binding protein YciE